MGGDSGEAAFGVVAFLLVWVTFWTLGGIAAGLVVLKQILGREVIRADGEGITVLNYIGPFCKRKRIRRDEIKALRLQKQKAYLIVETTSSTFTLASLGSAEDRKALRQRIMETFGLDARPREKTFATDSGIPDEASKFFVRRVDAGSLCALSCRGDGPVFALGQGVGGLLRCV